MGETIVYICAMKIDDYIYVFVREFLICDVAQGLIGDPPILSKGHPPV